MSTFSGLSAALSGLSAARAGLDTVGQNLTNLKTAGYTRQRLETSAVAAGTNTSLYSAGAKPGQGVAVTGISRLGDEFLDARVRTASSNSGYTTARAGALDGIEGVLGEPGPNGLSTGLQGFWAAWQEVSNHPGETASGAVLLQKAGSVTATISSGYTALENQWSQTRATVDSLASDLNTSAQQVAALNGQIRAAQSAGSPANELIDRRNLLAEHISEVAGGTVRTLPDGTNEILLGGNQLVSGTQANAVKVSGATSMRTGQPVQLDWARPGGSQVELDGGTLAGNLSVLAPAAADGTGGDIAEAAEGYNRLAATLAAAVNAVHRSGTSPDGKSGQDFFTIKGAGPAAVGLAVVPVSAQAIAAGTGGKDGSVADKLGQLGTAAEGPSAQWTASVVRIGTAVKVGLQQAAMADSALAGAQANQLANASVDLDEENTNLLAFQHAYQAAARVLTAVDETLDVLINQTGRVGR